MDSQRPFLYLTLLFMLFLIWTTWQQDHAPKPPVAAASSVTAPASVDGAAQEVPVQSSVAAIPGQVAPVPAADNGVGQTLTVRTDTLVLRINTRGGEILETDLPTYPVSLDTPDKPVKILDLNGRNYVAQSGLQHQVAEGIDAKSLAPDHLAIYSAAQTEYTLAEGQNELIVPLTWQGANGVTVTKRFVFKRGSFLVNVEHEVNNQSTSIWSGTEYRQLKHGYAANAGSLLSGVQAYVGGAYFHDGKYTKLSFDDLDEKPVNETVNGGWVAMQEHYFLSAWIPQQDQETQYYSMVSQNQGVKGYVLGMRSAVQQIAPGATGVFKTGFYVGPKDQDMLESIATGLDLTVDYGIFAFISKPIFWLMQMIHGVVGNWGWTIIFLTILIKLAFFYPSAMSYKSMAKMKAVSPKLKEINERYANDPQGKQKAMMDIYRKEKINPLGGCLPILIQIPVFMGLYWVLLESVELRQAPWLLWYKDLSIMDPYFVLPLIMGASMWVQQKLNPPPADPMQQKIFQFMPIIFTVMFLWFPAGLVLYWVVNNVLSIAQQWFINKKIVGHA
ncbi:MAG: membrane protein insertase YidC [Candidatus Thiothrix putei]|uniref:Membrane protein insertase YidC n=2 Tax=Thiothrix TaxID=1030 RepID=A0A1H4FKN4_9GAMM|nr:membrane protein insertase YidC [Thiothrix caldifontis]WGZ94507.1 MAG: membrane protein insertase YidC [Candidatus Thiothrix putei]SEA97370.1 YidC/Oxa1 family membrane protein insertase [Thiothrix caldifontis]